MTPTQPAPSLGPILAATDFSAPARHAAERAARLAQEAGAALLLMHVLPGGALHGLPAPAGTGPHIRTASVPHDAAVAGGAVAAARTLSARSGGN